MDGAKILGNSSWSQQYFSITFRSQQLLRCFLCRKKRIRFCLRKILKNSAMTRMNHLIYSHDPFCQNNNKKRKRKKNSFGTKKSFVGISLLIKLYYLPK